MRRLLARWTPLGVVEALVLAVCAYVVLWSLHPSLVFSSSLLTGGDTGAHLALPAYLRTQHDLFNVTPWYPGWFAGMPAYTYYFVLPDLVALLLSYVINFAVAFKLATILGSLVMPLSAYVMARLLRAARPVPIALALATMPFMYDASFTIDGGNLFSTMAGEYAFSMSLALAMVTIGLFARGMRRGRGYWLAALGLSLTLAAHLLPWFFVIAAVGVMVVFETLQRHGIGDPTCDDVVEGDYARPFRFALGAGIISAGLSAWWLVPFALTQQYTNSMGYTNDDVSSVHAVATTLGWFNASGGAGGDRWVIVLGLIGVVLALSVRDRLGSLLATLTILSVVAYVVDPQGVIWNERLIPFWFLTIHLMAGWLVGYLGLRYAERRARVRDFLAGVRRSRDESWMVAASLEPDSAVPSALETVSAQDFLDRAEAEALQEVAADGAESEEGEDLDAEAEEDEEGADSDDEPARHIAERRHRRLARATLALFILGMVSVVPGQIPALASRLHLSTQGNQVSNWAQWNYSGYQGKASWPEYHGLMDLMGNVSRHYGCGRAMWEYNSSENRFGTPMALMLLPYWTNNCVDSMEGLFFESSATTPYHFIDQAELSASPSDPQVGLDYPSLDVASGVRHLQMLGVRYFIAFSPSVVSEANADPSLQLVASTRQWPAPGVKWYVYVIKDSPMVQALAHLPNVLSNVSSRPDWLAANQTWWLTPKLQDVYAAASGPSDWPRATSVTSMHTSARLPTVTVSQVEVATQAVSFHVSRVGVPILVKTSYFPRWRATGATGPYRVSPNLMVVVPTSHTVTVFYGASTGLTIGSVASDLTVGAGLVYLYVYWRTRRRRRVDE